MRILYDSKLSQFKAPFGTLIPDQECTLNMHIPSTGPMKIEDVLDYRFYLTERRVVLSLTREDKPYEVTITKEEYDRWRYYYPDFDHRPDTVKVPPEDLLK